MSSVEQKTARHNLTEKELFNMLLTLSPEPVKLSVPADAAEQKTAFLRGEIDNPIHRYDRLHDIDLNQQRERILDYGEQLLAHDRIDDAHKDIYKAFIHNYLAVNKYLQLVQRYQTGSPDTSELRESIKTL